MEDVALTASILNSSTSDPLHNFSDNYSNSNSNSKPNFTFRNNFKLKSNALLEVVNLGEPYRIAQSDTELNKMHSRTQSPQKPNLITVTETQSKLKNNSSRNLTVPQKDSNIRKSSLNSSVRLNETGNSEILNKNKRVKITSRIVFLKVGQIDTRNERFDAEAFIECTWEDDVIFKILADPNMSKNLSAHSSLETLIRQAEIVSLSTNNLINLKNIISNINVLEYDPNFFWSPQLYIENAIGELKEEIRHRLEIVEKEGSHLLDDPNYNPKNGEFQELINNLTVRVSEMRKLRGVFYERLELYDFPMDTQELSITLTSKRNSSEIEFVENPKDACSINTEDFLDQQEWDLFSHVKTGNRTIYDSWRKYERTGFQVSCFIARKPGYYLYNAYMLIFLITILGFVPFAFDVKSPQFRCQVTGLLLLTSVNFRWVITQRLPSVPYLTSLDKYAIGSLLYLVLFCVWHSIIGSNIISDEFYDRKKIDRYVLFGSVLFCITYNLCYVIWFVKMSKGIRKFQLEGLREAAEQAKQRDKLNKKDAQESQYFSQEDQKDYEELQKRVKKELSDKAFNKGINGNPNTFRQTRLVSQPNTNDHSLLIATA